MQSSKQVHGKHLFTFGLIADSHLRSPRDTPSPWKTNELANKRTEFVLAQVAAAKPDFVIHLGDVTNPVPHLATYDSACEEAKRILGTMGLQTYIVAGNHDVGDKVTYVLPNHPVDDYSLRRFEGFYGPTYQSFDVGGVHFIIFNSSLIGSDLPDEAEQSRWLKDDLERHAGKRIYVFCHYPIFMTEPDEPALYDNIEVAGRGEILRLLEEYGVEAAFAGHVHNFFYNRYGATEMYGMLSTTFVRQDYSEMFNAPPGAEYGRDDTAKIGWAEVKVYEEGHVIEVHRALDPLRVAAGERTAKVALDLESHPKFGTRSGLGIHLREAWAEKRPLPYLGPQDEFERRRARNDYALMALWECGLRELRVPMKDLLTPDYLERMIAMAEVGHRFTLFHAGFPDESLVDALLRNASLASAVEIILPWVDIEADKPTLEAFVGRCGLPVFVAPIASPMDHKQKTYKFAYFTSFGFDSSEVDMLEAFHEEFGRRLGVGYTFRLGPDQSPLEHGAIIRAFAERTGAPAMFNVASLSGIPDLRFDDVATATRSAEATLLAASSPLLTVFIDTLVDMHRGYTPRSGLYDGRYNPRLAGKVVANLQSVLRAGSGSATVSPASGTDILECTIELGDGSRATLVAPLTDATREAFVSRMREPRYSGGVRVRLSTLAEGVPGAEVEAEPYLLIADRAG